MKSDITIKKACGCVEVRPIRWDGRRKTTNQWLMAGEAQSLRLGESSGYYDLHPRTWQELLGLRCHPEGEKCIPCTRKEAEQAAKGLFQPPWYMPRCVIRAITRIAKMTGGKVSRSPKSDSHYVTFSNGAWRVSDHPWPGCPQSLVSQHRAGRWYVARLTANWLAVELAK